MRKYLLFGSLTVLVLTGIALLPLVASARPEPREIVLVARGMTFYLDGEPAPNPTIVVAPGERVRFVLRNEEPGIVHDFVVRDWQVATAQLNGLGAASVEVTIPNATGRTKYTCTPHSLMMSGMIEIKASTPPRR